MGLCTDCGMTNHDVDTCFKKHGYPPHWQYQGQINNVSTEHEQEDEAHHESSEEQLNDTASGIIGFTPAQHKALLALLQQSSTSHNVNHLVAQSKSISGIIYTFPTSNTNKYFILDTRATDRVCFYRRLFSCLKKISEIIVKLRNGSLMSTHLYGTIHFDANFVLTNVLYTPHITFNLMSIHKLTYHFDCQLIFDNFTCFIQTTYLKKKISTTKLRGGIYILNQPSVDIPSHLSSPHTSILAINYVFPTPKADCNLWHWRLGQPSNTKLTEIKKRFPFITISSYILPCDICFYAK